MFRRLGFPATGLALALFLLVPHPLAAQDSDYSYARVVRLSLVEGDVQIARPEEDGWQPALLNMPIRQGYAISTGQGRAEIEFESGATARIAENSHLEFTELALSNGARLTRMTLRSGTATFYANLDRNDTFSVETPHLLARITDNDRFRVDASSRGSTVKVLKGHIDVETSAGIERLARGQSLLYNPADPGRVWIARSGEPDSWDRWAADRDEVVATSRSSSSRYLSSGYQYGAAELSYYGNWISVPGYGYGWRPSYVNTSWSPYWNGRWVFVNGVGLTWVSYEPWGWLPYHFGFWLSSPQGWVWLRGPSSGWHPGIVNWVHVGGSIGWCPRTPHDRPGRIPVNAGVGTVINTATGIMTGRPHVRPVNPRLSGNPRWGVDPPIRGEDFVNARGVRSLDPAERPRFGGATGVPRGPRTGGAEGEVAGDQPRTVRPRVGSGNSGIVYDGRDGRFVNSNPTPRTPQGEEETDSDRPVRAPMWGQRGAAGTAPRGGAPARADEPGAIYDPDSRRWVNNPAAPTRVEPQPEVERAPRTHSGEGRPSGFSGRGADNPPPQRPDSSGTRTYSPPSRSESPRHVDSTPRSAPSDRGGWRSSPRGSDSPRMSSPSHDSGGRMSPPPSPPPSSSSGSRPAPAPRTKDP